MATDMWTMINRELSKIEGLRGGASNTPYLDVVSETMRYAKEDRAWKEKKNAQRLQVMTTFSNNLNTMYDNKEVAVQKDRAQQFFNKHSRGMDDFTLETGQVILDNFDLQTKKNNSFSQYQARQDDEMKKVMDFTGGLKVGEEYTEEEYDKKLDEFRDVFQGYVNFTEEFGQKHFDRLTHPSFQHVNTELAHGSYINQFLLDSFFDDKKIDDVEYKAYTQSIASNSIKPITDYLTREREDIKNSSKLLNDRMDADAQTYEQLTSIINSEIPIPGRKDAEGNPIFYNSDPTIVPDIEELRETIDTEQLDLYKELNRDNKTGITRTGRDKLERDYPNLFGVKPPDKVSIFNPEQLANFKSLGYNTNDIKGLTSEQGLDIIEKQTKKIQTPPKSTTYNPQQEKVSKAESSGKKQVGNKFIGELKDLEAKIETMNNNLTETKTKWKAMKDRKEAVRKEIKDFQEIYGVKGFPVPAFSKKHPGAKYKKWASIPQDELNRYGALLKEYNDLKEKTNIAGSRYKTTPQATIDSLVKKIEEAESKKLSIESRLGKLIKTIK